MTERAIDIIRSEHQALAAMLRSLKLVLERSRRDGRPPDFELLRAMLFYVDEFPERLHHRKESELLFPALRARAPELEPVLDRLDVDHTSGEHAVRQLEHALLAFEVMGDARRVAFEQAVERYVGNYLRHMAVEEEAVLPAAQKLLSGAEWAALNEAFAAHRDPLTGHEPEEVYRQLFSLIVNRAPAPIGLGPA